MACGASGGPNARCRIQQVAAEHAGKQDVERVGQPLRRMPGDDEARHPLLQLGFQQIAQHRHALCVPELLPRDSACHAEPDDIGHVLCAGPQPVLLPRAVDERPEPRAVPPDVERADPFRRVELMTGNRQQIDAERVHIDRHLADRLRRIGMDDRAIGLRELRNLGKRLQRADLVLRMDDGDERGVSIDLRRHLAKIDTPGTVDADTDDIEAFPLQTDARHGRSGMLDRRGNDPAPRSGRSGDTTDRVVAGLRPAAGENDLIGTRADQRGNLAARRLNRIPCPPAESIGARRVAELLAEVGQHRLEHLARHGGCRVEIEIDCLAAHCRPLALDRPIE